MWLMCLDLDNLPFFSKIMSLLWYCISLLCVILYPYAYRKYMEHSILAMVPYTPISSSSVDISPFIFRFAENLDTAPFPRGIIDPVCPWQSLCTVYAASTHHFTTDMPPALKASFSYLIPLRYFNTRLSFTSSPCLFFHACGDNATLICMSWHALELMNSRCATVWIKVCDWSSGRYCV